MCAVEIPLSMHRQDEPLPSHHFIVPTTSFQVTGRTYFTPTDPIAFNQRQRARSLHQQFSSPNSRFAFNGQFSPVKRSASEILSRPIVVGEKRLRTEDESIKKGTWSEEEDMLLVRLLQDYPSFRWSDIASMVPGRSAKQCRERWSCNLDPAINKQKWTPQEDRMILTLQKDLGNKWAQIATYLTGRTENAVKTRYKSIIRAQKREWSQEEDDTIMALQKQHGSNWELIAKKLPNRTKNAVKTRYRLLAKGKASKTPELGAPNQILFNEDEEKQEVDEPNTSYVFANPQIHCSFPIEGPQTAQQGGDFVDFLNTFDDYENLNEYGYGEGEGYVYENALGFKSSHVPNSARFCREEPQEAFQPIWE